jgi:hypothetical protein
MANAAAPAPRANMGEPAPRLDARLKRNRRRRSFLLNDPAAASTGLSAGARIRGDERAERRHGRARRRSLPPCISAILHRDYGGPRGSGGRNK